MEWMSVSTKHQTILCVATRRVPKAYLNLAYGEMKRAEQGEDHLVDHAVRAAPESRWRGRQQRDTMAPIESQPAVPDSGDLFALSTSTAAARALL